MKRFALVEVGSEKCKVCNTYINDFGDLYCDCNIDNDNCGLRDCDKGFTEEELKEKIENIKPPLFSNQQKAIINLLKELSK